MIYFSDVFGVAPETLDQHRLAQRPAVVHRPVLAVRQVPHPARLSLGSSIPACRRRLLSAHWSRGECRSQRP